jgi:hypothetical protein
MGSRKWRMKKGNGYALIAAIRLRENLWVISVLDAGCPTGNVQIAGLP